MATVCKVPGCEWQTFCPETEVAHGLAVWHVYEVHRDEWVAAIGEDRPPRDPDPRTNQRYLISGNL